MTLNLCLGLPAKKNLIKETILHEKIDILSMQETEINFNLGHSLLSFPEYSIEVENNSLNVAFYISNEVNYATRALNANGLIKNYFNSEELLQLMTSNFYSILYYLSSGTSLHSTIL